MNSQQVASIANRLEREMGVREALLYVKAIAERNEVSTSGGIDSIIERLAAKNITV